MVYLRSALFQLLFYLWTVLCGTAFVPLLVMPRRLTVFAGRSWCYGVMWMLRHIVGLTYRVDGWENAVEGPAIFAFKHQSAWDTVVVTILIRDPAIALKRELLPIPFFGWYLWKHGMIAIDRKAGAKALRRLVADAGRALAQGRRIVVFPEGTRTAPGRRRPYQPGVAALYGRLAVPVIPVALNSGVFWRRRGFLKRPGCVRVAFLPPIAPGLGRREFMATLEDRIESATEELVEDALRNMDPRLAGELARLVGKTGQAPVKTVEN
jgi:1-acyl-sn-glycerol-3-phosphate acyltransferase